VELVQEFTPFGSRSLLAASFDDGGMDDDFENIFYYDNLQRMVQIDQSGVQGGNTVAEKRVNFAYNAAGQFTSIDRYKDTSGGSGNLVVETDFVYDGIGRLTDLTHVYDTTTIADYDWTFDAFSRVTSMSFSSLVGNDGNSTYDYDDTNQLIDADYDFQTDETYTYDENGNRTISGYVTGDNNLLSTDGTYNYSYDDEGNRVLKTNISTGDYVEYAWDHRNRLVSITQRDDQDAITHEVIYTYDIFNRRILKEIDTDGAGGGGVETIQYIYLCSCQRALGRILTGKDGERTAGAPAAAGNTEKREGGGGFGGRELGPLVPPPKRRARSFHRRTAQSARPADRRRAAPTAATGPRPGRDPQGDPLRSLCRRLAAPRRSRPRRACASARCPAARCPAARCRVARRALV
jgi:hypothetical protein